MIFSLYLIMPKVIVIFLPVSEYVMALLYDGPISKASRSSKLYTPIIDMQGIGCISFDFLLAAGVELSVQASGKQELSLYHWKATSSTGWNHVRMFELNLSQGYNLHHCLSEYRLCSMVTKNYQFHYVVVTSINTWIHLSSCMLHSTYS